MWEFSINLMSDKSLLATELFNVLRKELSRLGAIVARSEEGGYIGLIIAVDEKYRKEAELTLLQVVSIAICSHFKAEFLNKHLFLPNQDEMGVTAFKKALINFDKETDYFLISKNISFEKSLYLESFYQFKLPKLRDKWGELIRLANENRDYLVSTDAFFDLLKFLIDNLDICREEIDVFEEEEGYCIYENDQKSEPLSSSALVSSLIDLSPQKINLYYKHENRATDLLKVIFDRRISFRSSSDATVENISKTLSR